VRSLGLILAVFGLERSIAKSALERRDLVWARKIPSFPELSPVNASNLPDLTRVGIVNMPGVLGWLQAYFHPDECFRGFRLTQ
jgi:hypothetical protein